jgi:hypothetical protein
VTVTGRGVSLWFGEGGAMDEFKRSPHDSLIEEAIRAKGPSYSEASARTLRTDTLAILEAIVAEADEAGVAGALERQGFRSSGSYLTTLRTLAAVALSRRPAAAPLSDQKAPRGPGMTAGQNDIERVALWLYDAATVAGKVAEVRAVLRVMMDQAIAGEGERGEDEQYADGSAPELASRFIPSGMRWHELLPTNRGTDDGPVDSCG